jgi:hypothetical protein
MSFGLRRSRGIFASTSPANTVSPSLTIKCECDGMWYFRDTFDVGCPCASSVRISIAGCFFSSGESMMINRDRPGHFVDFLVDRSCLEDVLEAHLARLFGEDRERIRIPLDEHLTRLDLLPSCTRSFAPYTIG